MKRSGRRRPERADSLAVPDQAVGRRRPLADSFLCRLLGRFVYFQYIVRGRDDYWRDQLREKEREGVRD